MERDEEGGGEERKKERDKEREMIFKFSDYRIVHTYFNEQRAKQADG